MSAQLVYLISATFLVMSGMMGLLIVLFRWPLGGPHWSAPAKGLLLAGAAMLVWQEGARHVLSGAWRSYAPVLPTTVIVLFAPALALPSVAGDVGLCAALAGVWVWGLRALLGGVRALPWWNIAVAVTAGAGLGAAYFLIVNTKGYANVLSLEQTLVGLQHRDTLYHAAMAAMIANYGVASTGLDGLMYVPYHILSHVLIGLAGRWMGVAPIESYYLVPHIVLVPLLLFALSAATLWLWRPRCVTAAGPLAVLVPVGLLGVVEIGDWASYLVSESYCLALIVLLLALPLLLEMMERPHDTRGLMRCATVGLAGLALFLAKNSVGAIFLAAAAFALVRTRGVQVGTLVKLGLPLAIPAGLGILATYQTAYTHWSLIKPLHFFTTFPKVAYINLAAIGLVLLPAYMLWRYADTTRRYAIELLALLAAAGLSIGLLVRIDAGAAYYFLNVGTWMAIALAAGVLIIPWFAERMAPALSVGAAGLMAIGAFVAQPQLRDSGPEFRVLLSQIGARAEVPGAQSAEASPSGLWATLFSPTDPQRARVAAAAQRSVGGEMIRALGRARARSWHDRVVYVPPNNRRFWGLHEVCTAQPFTVPATIATPMIHGLPPDETACPLVQHQGYGYDFYPKTARSHPLSDAQLCERARQIAFADVVILLPTTEIRLLRCR